MKLKNKTNDFLFFHGLKSFKPNEEREVTKDQDVARLLRCPSIEKVSVEKQPTEDTTETTEEITEKNTETSGATKTTDTTAKKTTKKNK